MPLPQITKISTLDLQKNIAIGVSLPFNTPAVFKPTFSTQDQIKSNLINLLLTNKGERILNQEFGTDLRRVLFEGITETTAEIVRELILSSVTMYIPEVSIKDIIVNPDEDNNTISILVKYQIKLSGTQDQILIQLV